MKFYVMLTIWFNFLSFMIKSKNIIKLFKVINFRFIGNLDWKISTLYNYNKILKNFIIAYIKLNII